MPGSRTWLCMVYGLTAARAAMVGPTTPTRSSELIALSSAQLEVTEGEAVSIDSGERIWDAGRALSLFLSERALAGRHVLELGSGTGIVGLTAAALGAHVLLSDQPELVPLIDMNIVANGLSANARAVPLVWGDPNALDRVDFAQIDLVCGSDLLYAPTSFDALLETMVQICKPGHTEVLLAYPPRYTEDIFLEQADEHFELLEVSEIEPAIFLSRLRRRALDESTGG